jgi:hypothetical protein
MKHDEVKNLIILSDPLRDEPVFVVREGPKGWRV